MRFSRSTIKINSEFLLVVIISENIAGFQKVIFTKYVKIFSNSKLLCSQKFLCISLPGLIQCKLEGKLLSFEGYWERIFSGVGNCNLSNFDSVICQEIMNNVLLSITFSVEFKNFSVVFKELFFRVNFSTAKLLL